MTTGKRDSRAEWRAAISSPLGADVFHPLASAVQLEIAGASACGKSQTLNTDHYLAIRLGRLQETLTTSLGAADLPPAFEEHAYALLLADGLDGDVTGARASRLALSALAHEAIRHGQWNVRIGPENVAEVIQQGQFFYRRVNDVLFDAGFADDHLKGMATSLTVAYVAGTDLFFSHVGHARVYLFRDGGLIQLTMERTLAQLISTSSKLRRMRLEARRPHAQDAKSDAVGTAEGPIGTRDDAHEVSIEHVQLWSGDRILLCTNGLTDAVAEDQIADVLASHRGPRDDCRRLVDLAVAAGATDSATAMLADYHVRSAPPRPEDAIP